MIRFVPETGIEPAHPCGRQILSLLRLPIPPPGLKKLLAASYKLIRFSRACEITTSRLIAVEYAAGIFS